MSEIDKNINDWDEFDPDLLSSYIQKLSLEPTIPDITNSLDVLDDSLENDPNRNINENLDDKPLLKDKIQNEKEEESLETSYLQSDSKEPVAFISNKEKGPISVRKDTNVEESDIANSDLSYSSSDSDSDDSDSLLTRGKEKTKRRSSSRKQYERPSRNVNVLELNQHSLQFLSSGFIVQNNADKNLQSSSQAQFVNSSSLFSAQPIESTSFTYCSINSPLNVSSPESGYDTQTSEVFSPSPPSILPTFSRNSIDEERELQLITDSVLGLEESLKVIETQQLEFNIPGLDDFEYNDYIEQVKLFLQEPDSGSYSNTIDSEHNLRACESSRSEVTDYIPLDSLLDDFESVSNSNSVSTNSSVSEIEYIQSATNIQETSPSASHSSVRPNKRKLNFKLKDIAKHQVRFSENFNNNKYSTEMKRVLEEVRVKKQCIDIEQLTENSKRTNLHNAVLSSNIERIYCLVEIQKKLFKSIQFQINIRDDFEKTALDYAEELKLPLIIDYLKENLAVRNEKC